MNSLDSLWELQEIRRRYLALKKKEQNALNSAEARALEGKLNNLREKQQLIEAKIKSLEKELNRRTMDFKSHEEKKGSLREELYSGKAKAKELSNLQKRLEATELELSNVEEDVLRLSEELEMLRQSVGSIHRDVEDIENQLGVLQANLEVELQGLRAEMEEVKKIHSQVLKKIDKKTLDLYNRKFKQHSVTTVAKVLGGLCTGCNVHLPRYLIAEVKTGDSLVGCENCGRILYYPVRSE